LKAVELDPGFWVGWMDLGLLLAIRGQQDDATDCAEQAMAGRPTAAWSRVLQAVKLA
jgi:hypothetical protein